MTDWIVYGAGGCGREARQVLEGAGSRVLGFLDRNASGPVGGLPCARPESEQAQRWRESGAAVAIGVWNPHAPLDEIEAALRADGWAQVENFPRLHAPHFGSLGERYWLGDPALYESDEARAQIETARGLWRDEKSQKLFEAWMQARRDGNVAPLNQMWREEKSAQYFPNDVPGWPCEAGSLESFVDCGAYDGDTLRELPGLGVASPSLRYFGFEPDPANFARLGAEARSLSASAAGWQSTLWPCGVWSTTTTLRFRASGLASAGVDPDGEQIVPVVALDEVLQGVPVGVVKMDIEGAEPQALEGARGLIERQRPCLAVCVYHHAAHAWEIPLQVAGWGLGYSLSLRAHAANGFDWVLYAVAE